MRTNIKYFFSKLKNKFFKKIAYSFPSNSVRIWGLRKCGFFVGKDVYLGTELLIVTETGYSPILYIADRVSIGPRVTVVLASGSNHSKLLQKFPLEVGDIIIKEDAWIGTGAIIYPKTIIGECSIVAAGAVVNKNVEPMTIVGGVPAKKISNIVI